MVPCEKYREMLSARLDRELTPAGEVELEAHLETCAACRAYARQMEQLEEALQNLEDEMPPEGFSARVMERVRKDRRGRILRFRRPALSALAGLAACLVVCVGIWRAGLPQPARQISPGNEGTHAASSGEVARTAGPGRKSPEPEGSSSVEPNSGSPLSPADGENRSDPAADRPESGQQAPDPSSSSSSEPVQYGGRAEDPAGGEAGSTGDEAPSDVPPEEPAPVWAEPGTEPDGSSPADGSSGQPSDPSPQPSAEPSPASEPQAPAVSQTPAEPQTPTAPQMPAVTGEDAGSSSDPAEPSEDPSGSGQSHTQVSVASGGLGSGVCAALPPISVEGRDCTGARCLRVTWKEGMEAPLARIVGSADSLSALLEQYGVEDASLTGTYSPDYFARKSLVAVILEEPSGSIWHELPEQDLSGGSVTVKRYVPETGTTDMAAWLILGEVSTSLEDGQELQVQLQTG